jgi:hypothetical protein
MNGISFFFNIKNTIYGKFLIRIYKYRFYLIDHLTTIPSINFQLKNGIFRFLTNLVLDYTLYEKKIPLLIFV